MLYVPRGWWHNARVPETNNGAGSLHLTLTMASVTSIWVMRWLSGRLLDDELGRRDVPLSADDDARTDYFNRLAARITELLAEGFGERFVKDVRAAWSESLETDISAYVEPWRDPSWDRYLVRLKGRELALVELNAGGEFFTLKANGTALDLDLRCRDLISTLLDRESVAVGELKELHTGFPAGIHRRLHQAACQGRRGGRPTGSRVRSTLGMHKGRPALGRDRPGYRRLVVEDRVILPVVVGAATTLVFPAATHGHHLLGRQPLGRRQDEDGL